MDVYRADSPQLPFCGEDIVTYANPMVHTHSNGLALPLNHIQPNGYNPHIASWRCVPFRPMAVALDPMIQNHCPAWEPQQLPAMTKECRSKMTVPKPVVVELSEEEESMASSDMDESTLDPHEGEEMEQEPPHLKQPPIAREVIRPRPCGGRNGGRYGSIRDRRVYEEDYRRFSERSRKKTDFFGIHGRKKEEEEGKSQSGRNRGSGRKGRRELDLGNKLHLLDEKLAGSLEDVTAPGKEADGKEADGKDQVIQATAAVSPPPHVPVVLATSKDVVVNKNLQEVLPIGRMMWGKLLGYDWWPGYIVSHSQDAPKREAGGEEEIGGEADQKIWLKWFGETQLSYLAVDKLTPFEEFSKVYSPLAMKGLYRKAVFSALKVAMKRCKVELSSNPSDKTPRWAVTDNSPTPTLIRNKEEEASPSPSTTASMEGPPSVETTPTSGGKKKRRGRKKVTAKKATPITFTAYEQEMIEWACNGFFPSGPEGLWPSPDDQDQIHVVPFEDGYERESPVSNNNAQDFDYQPRKKSKVMLVHVKKIVQFENVRAGNIEISDICIGCGDLNILTVHPLFQGGYCKDCSDSFLECAYRFDEDGTQMYCCICSGGEEVYLCDAQNCAKVYCGPCIEKLCGEAELLRVRQSPKWECYMCSPTHSKVGLICPRVDWDVKLRELFMGDHDREFAPPKVFPPIPPKQRRPLRVLGLFDGIGTGKVVLDDLGFVIDKYVSCEIDLEAMNVCRVNHNDVVHVGDIQEITEVEVRSWGPFDLVYGGSPCNDLSVVNPARKGIYRGTGKLFFEFFRILSYIKPSPEEDRPFFWLYENVVSMRPEDKETISRFMQVNPVVVNAKEISPARRARFFWGNIPGMNRQTVANPADRLVLQDCLDPNCFRKARVTKMRTITTKMNSIKQTKAALFPVLIEGQEEGDVLWCTEMERLFGFPEHYTDVCNMGRSGRQRLLGKAWSVPVVRHLLSPLKDYFVSSTTMETGKDQPTCSFYAAAAKITGSQ